MSDDVLELLEDDATFGEIVEQVRTDREAKGLDPDTGEAIDPTPWCLGCGAKHQQDCHCGPIAANN